MVLDDRWSVGYWAEADIAPGRPCDACGQRASIHLLGGRIDEDEPADLSDDAQFLDEKLVHLCGWCHIEGPILNEDDLQRELAAAASDSVAWHWRWQPGRR